MSHETLGQLTTDDRRVEEFQLGDSPWFWLALFGTVAVAGLLIVNQKYSARQSRLELRFQNRVELTERRQAAARGEELAHEVEPPISARALNPRAALAPLLAVFGGMAIAGYLGLAFAWRRFAADADARSHHRHERHKHDVDH